MTQFSDLFWEFLHYQYCIPMSKVIFISLQCQKQSGRSAKRIKTVISEYLPCWNALNYRKTHDTNVSSSKNAPALGLYLTSRSSVLTEVLLPTGQTVNAFWTSENLYNGFNLTPLGGLWKFPSNNSYKMCLLLDLIKFCDCSLHIELQRFFLWQVIE